MTNEIILAISLFLDNKLNSIKDDIKSVINQIEALKADIDVIKK